MLRTLMIWGLLAGLVAGLFAFGTASLLGEPAVKAAIAYEEAHAEPEPAAAGAAHSHGEEAEVSRGTQTGIGLFTGLAVYGVAFGGLLALAFAFIYGRVGKASPRITGLWVGLGAFTTIYLVPFIKYPATPPAIGSGDTIGKRTLLYFGIMVIALLAAYIGVRARAWLLARRADVATLGGVATFFVIVLAAALFLPGVNEIPADFPAVTLWEFRFGNLATQATLWAVLTVGFSYAAQRAMTREATARSAAPAAAATA
ncbi:MAG: CbtA family protein [Solirubrobacteraceae bacterium]|nr:CbtA family protein [Solirubrobacteraceae bacterium]